MRYSGLLWNSVAEYASEILSDISKDYNVLRVQVFDVASCLDSFIKDIYTGDSIADWKVNRKIECLQSFSDRKITVFDIEIPNPIYSYVDVKKRETCSQVENLKKSIRGNYSQKVQPYFFDTIIHICDDQRENILMQKVLTKYEGCRISEPQYDQNVGVMTGKAKPISVRDAMCQRGGRG